MKLLFLFLFFPVVVFAQTNIITQEKIPETNDDLVLINEVDPGLYSGFKITRGPKTIFTFNKSIIEIQAGTDSLDPLLKTVVSDGRRFIILKVCGRPSAGWYLCIEQIKNGYKLLGETPPCTGEIFEDIDSDGVIEIGLTHPLHEGGQSKEEYNNHLLKYVKVVELNDNFPVDEKMTDLHVTPMLIK